MTNSKIECEVFVATSLDGYIARKDGNLDWLDKFNETITSNEDSGYNSFMETIDGMVMGRNTFEKVLSFGIDWPYGDKKVFVLTTQNISIPSEIQDRVVTVNKSPETLLSGLKVQGFKKLYIDGAKTIQGFLKEGLIDRVTVSVIPVLIGDGISLFGELKNDIALNLVSSKYFSYGMVQNTYNVVK